MNIYTYNSFIQYVYEINKYVYNVWLCSQDFEEQFKIKFIISF